MGIESIRNFCIVAHIDHGKSTLADRILEFTHTIAKRDLREQYLDGHAIERERGITIKAKAVAIAYRNYRLNLIDTPGHVDFSYEVSRSLAACEGAVLLIDATQGVQAQTIANATLALEANLEIIPVLNKIDMPIARPDEVLTEIEHTIGMKPDEVLRVSAKNGTGVPELLEAIITRLSSPRGDAAHPLQALVFDSVYDAYRGVVVYVRLKNGTLKKGMPIRFIGSGGQYVVEDVGVFRPWISPVDTLSAGEVGYFIANIKSVHDVRVGDTVTLKEAQDVASLPGYKEPLPVVFCGFYPSNDTDFNNLKKALERLSLNDSSFRYQPETSEALGFGFRCGFLGLLHMDIIRERLERDEHVDVIQTAPNVTYEIVAQTKNGLQTMRIDNPAKLPDESLIQEWREPYVRAHLIVPNDCIGIIMKLCEEKRGNFMRTDYISQNRAMMTYEIPFAEIVFDFYDKMKSATRGYGTMDYSLIGHRTGDLVLLRIVVAGQEIDALCTIVHREFSEHKGRKIIKILRNEIPRHLFQIALQASIGKKIIAREDIKPMAKNVTGKCYGGDITRKRKLWEKQKEGKRKMKSVGRVDIPQEAFMAVLTTGDNES